MLSAHTAARHHPKHTVESTLLAQLALCERFEFPVRFSARSVDEGRRWRCTRPFGGVTDWDYEIGDPPSTHETSAVGTPGGLVPSSLNVSEHERAPFGSTVRPQIPLDFLFSFQNRSVYTMYHRVLRDQS